MSKEELRQRILEGHRNIERLCEIVDKLPKGLKRDEIGGKSIRLLQSLHDLEDGFIELYPNTCLFVERWCLEKNKGTFVCDRCPSYLNTVYSVEQVKLI